MRLNLQKVVQSSTQVLSQIIMKYKTGILNPRKNYLL